MILLWFFAWAVAATPPVNGWWLVTLVVAAVWTVDSTMRATR